MFIIIIKLKSKKLTNISHNSEELGPAEVKILESALVGCKE